MDALVEEAKIGLNLTEFAINKICRACLCTSEEMFSLFENIKISDKSVLLADLLVNCANIQVSKYPDFPSNLCKNCMENALISYKFRLQCENSDNKLHSGYLTKFLENQTIKTEDKSIIKPEKLPPKESNEDDLTRRTCPDCGKLFQYRASMLKHRRRHTAPPKTCNYCNFQPTTATQIVQHMEENHSDKKTIICTICGKRFFRENNLKTHLLIHSGVRRHICEICGVSFTLGGNLLAHRRLHTGEKPYTCTHCGRSFTQQSTLRSHEASHTSSKNFVCSDCGVAFSRAGALRNHQKRHLNVKPYECSMCGKAFVFSSERKRHMTTHTGVKNHVCELCGRRFNRSTNLKVHRRIHTGETPYCCMICGKGFIQEHCLKTHMNTHKQA